MKEQVERARIIGRIAPNQEAPRPEDDHTLTIAERAALVHREAVNLQPGGDAVALKFSLKQLVADAQQMLREVDDQINQRRKNERGGGNDSRK